MENSMLDYLQRQITDLEDSRQELHSQLRKEKKTSYDLRVQLKQLQLSEENLKNQLNQISEEELKLISENDLLADKVSELEEIMNLRNHEMANQPDTNTVKVNTDLTSEDVDRLLAESKDLRSAEHKNKSFDDELRNLDLQNQQLVDARDRLIQKAERDAEAMQRLRAEIEKLNDDVYAWKRLDEERVDVMKNIEKKNTDLHAINAKLEQENNTLTDRVNDLLRNNKLQKFDFSPDQRMVPSDPVNNLADSEEKKIARYNPIIDNSKVLDEIDVLKRMLSQKDTEIHALKGQNYSTNIAPTNQIDYERRGKELDVLRRLLAQKDLEIEATNHEHNRTAEKLRAVEEQVKTSSHSSRGPAAVAAASRSNRDDIEDLQGIIEHKDREMEILKSSLNQKEAEISKLLNDINDVKKDNIILKQRENQLAKEIQDTIIKKDKEIHKNNLKLQEKAGALEEFKNAIIFKNKELQDEKEKELNNFKNLAELEHSRNELSLRNVEIENLKSNCNQLQEQNDKLLAALEKDSIDGENKITLLQNELTNLRQTNSIIKQKLEYCQTDLKNLNDKYKALAEEKNLRELSIRELHRQLAAQQRLTRELQSRPVGDHRTISNNDDIKELENVEISNVKDAAKLKVANEELEGAVSHFKKLVTQKDEEIKLVVNDLNNLHEKYVDSLKVTERNQERLRLLKDVAKSLLQQQRQDFEAMRLKWERGSMDASALKTELNALLRRLEDSDAEMRSLSKTALVAAEDSKHYKEAKDAMERNYLMQMEENGKLKEKFAAVESDMQRMNSDLSKSIAEQNAVLHRMSAKNRDLSTHLETCLNHSRNLEKRVSSLSLRLKEAELKNDKLPKFEEKIKELTVLQYNAEKMADEVRRQLDDQTEQFKVECGQLVQDRMARERDLAELRKRLDEMRHREARWSKMEEDYMLLLNEHKELAFKDEVNRQNNSRLMIDNKNLRIKISTLHDIEKCFEKLKIDHSNIIETSNTLRKSLENLEYHSKRNQDIIKNKDVAITILNKELLTCSEITNSIGLFASSL